MQETLGKYGKDCTEKLVFIKNLFWIASQKN